MDELISKQAVINTINVMRTRCDTDDIDDYHDLLLEAIEVLPHSKAEEVTDSDTISRQQAIDAIDILCGGCITDDVKNFVRYQLLGLPPSPSRPPWIPVTERLPESKQEVLVTEYGDTDIGRRFEGRWLDRYGDKMKDVTAWMPKPKPYQGD